MSGMKKSSSGIFEVIWFVLGGLLLFMAVDLTMDRGFSESWYYFLFSILAFLMYLARRKFRLSNRAK